MNDLTKEKAVRGCWKTGKNPLDCNKCGHQNICWDLYHKEPDRSGIKLSIERE